MVFCCCAPKCHCHCRANYKMPTDINDDNVDELLSPQGFQDRINDSNPMQSQYSWWRLSLLLDAYWWLGLTTVVVTLILTHAIPIAGGAWSTCTSYDPDRVVVFGLCSIGWHLFTVPLVVSWAFFGYYGLRFWSHAQVRLMSKILSWNSLTMFGFAVKEMVAFYVAVIDDRNPVYQTICYLTLTVALLVCVALGIYCQYKIQVFLYPPTKDFRLVYPSSEAEIISLIKQCSNEGLSLRCVGSEHSADITIWGDNPPDDVYQRSGVGTIMMSLDEYRDIVSIDKETKRVEVEAGIILGENEKKPWSKYKNGVLYKLDAMGWALPDLGGVIKQAIGGFTSMGCAGGTLMYDYFDAIHSIRIIDGRGRPRVFTRPKDIVNEKGIVTGTEEPDNPFWGAVTNMGLYGITSTITYQCIDKYNVIGSQVTMDCKNWAEKGDPYTGDGVGKINMKAKDNDDPESLYQMFTKPGNIDYKVEYSRFFWYPQTDHNWMVLWKAHRETEDDKKEEEFAHLYDKETGEFVGREYFEIAENTTASYVAQATMSFIYNIFANVTNPVTHQVNGLTRKLIDWIINFTIDPKKAGAESALQVFGGNWWRTIPMDQGIYDSLLPMQFTEIWVDIEDTTKCMNVLWKYFEGDNNLDRMGTFGWEFYCAKEQDCWIRPGYGRKSFRVDILWFDPENAIPYTFYNKFWEFMIENGIDFHAHWGKWAPAGEQAFPKAKDPKKRDFKTWADYYRSQLPKFDAFLELRKEMDPNGMFLTDYWERMLGIDRNDGKSDTFKADIAVGSTTNPGVHLHLSASMRGTSYRKLPGKY